MHCGHFCIFAFSSSPFQVLLRCVPVQVKLPKKPDGGVLSTVHTQSNFGYVSGPRDQFADTEGPSNNGLLCLFAAGALFTHVAVQHLNYFCRTPPEHVHSKTSCKL